MAKYRLFLLVFDNSLSFSPSIIPQKCVRHFLFSKNEKSSCMLNIQRRKSLFYTLPPSFERIY
ncbi:hypothetical protein, partial [Enterococcus faecalis]|uniref:hypothetical protein n=1 Tax=Enterococcus faecalis TaxID=1351 RepID=UPI003D6B82CF